MKIVIAGLGAVGLAVKESLDMHPHVEVLVDDPLLGYYNDDTDVFGVVVCVATPMSDDGSCETKNVKDVLEKYGECRYLIKSTIDPMFINDCPDYVTVSPEFLRGTIGSNPTKEFLDQEFSIFGGKDARFWHELFKTVLPKLNNVRYTTAVQAAFAKYVLNAFLATKVSFFNEMYKIYNSLGYDGFDTMIESICNDPRVGHSHTQVPGPDGKFGFGGHCLPKDISALIGVAKKVSVDPIVMSSVVNANNEDRK